MRVAYADPPYLGCCEKYGHFHGDDGLCWDKPSTHALLLERLRYDFPDGFAMSASSASLQTLLRFAPDDVRISAWVKPFASFKPNVNPAYAWEPVIWRGGRQPRSRDEPTVRDWYRHGITLKKGLVGAKPEGFCVWILDLLGVQEGDEVVDLFPGTGVMGRTLERQKLPLEGIDLPSQIAEQIRDSCDLSDYEFDIKKAASVIAKVTG